MLHCVVTSRCSNKHRKPESAELHLMASSGSGAQGAGRRSCSSPPYKPQVPRAGLATSRMRPAYLVRGLKEVVRKDRMEGRCRCVEADCCAIPYHGWHHHAEPEILCKRCKMGPARNVYSEEVMRALNTRGGPIWTRLLHGEAEPRGDCSTMRGEHYKAGANHGLLVTDVTASNALIAKKVQS
ncbi:unnamed protein product [Symbiodinium sp. CCMP2592]|nr:unnamed protein product [Symbiodinium sp. CCMP2592]